MENVIAPYARLDVGLASDDLRQAPDVGCDRPNVERLGNHMRPYSQIKGWGLAYILQNEDKPTGYCIFLLFNVYHFDFRRDPRSLTCDKDITGESIRIGGSISRVYGSGELAAHQVTLLTIDAKLRYANEQQPSRNEERADSGANLHPVR